jgi:hypothetical protein
VTFSDVPSCSIPRIGVLALLIPRIPVLGFVTCSIVQAPLQSELYPVFKSTSQDQNTPFWSSFNRHPVSLISLVAHLNFSLSSFHSSHLFSHLIFSLHLLLVHIGGSGTMPSHIQKGPSVTIPSVRRPKLSHQRLHPHFISPSRMNA